jgi:4-alpha-glucanotransferase
MPACVRTTDLGQAAQVTLHELAAHHGVATSYDDWSGRRVEVSPDAVRAALAALDVDASTDEALAAALAAARNLPWDRVAPPVLVVREGQPAVLDTVEGIGVTVLLEDGRRVDAGAPADGERHEDRVQRRFVLPELPLGYHQAEVRTPDRTATTAVIVVPERAPVPDGRHWGWQVQLYALRSQGSWGVGDYADLRTVLEASAADGASAVLVNPLHAETPALPLQNSPYSPSSRLFRAALYLRVEDVPEYASAPPEVRAAVDALKPVPDPHRIDRDAAWTAKRQALALLWPRHRVGALAAFRGDDRLERFALFCALAEVYGPDWRTWPDEFRTPTAAAAVGYADGVAFWCWVQLLVDEQLAGLGEQMALGVVHDLAVGVDGGGADAWAMRDVLALGTTVGAPPDSFNQKGQDWGLPPWRPDRLRQQGYQPFRQMVQAVLRHAGGIRIDHVMGLSRLWWVPAGAGAAEGTYVSYDAEALLGILALEATRAGAVVIGEDLGTVEPSVRRLLDRTAVLGSAVLWFETSEDGWHLPPVTWRREALASVTTHDLPTAAGWLAEEHVRVRHELGQLGHSLAEEEARARTEREMLLAMLRHEGLLEDDGDVVLALHRALVASPCRVVLGSYGDAVGDLRQPNLPGTVDEYPNWRLPVADADGTPLTLEQVLAHPGVRRITALLQEVR